MENKIKFDNIPFRKGSPMEFISIYMQNKTIQAAEIGVHEGKHAEYILNNNFFKNSNVKLQNLYLIDPYEEFTDSNNETYMKGDEGNKYYDNLKKRFQKYENVKIIRKKSVEASKDFENETLDFVYIDGNHQYLTFKDDLKYWYPKIKRYGIICGDDFGIEASQGIIRGLNEFCFEKKIFFHYAHYSTQFFLIKIHL